MDKIVKKTLLVFFLLAEFGILSANNYLNDFQNGIASIAAGSDNTYIVKKDGTLWVCGHQTNGELGLSLIHI